MIEPSELLKNLSMTRVLLHYALVGFFRTAMLWVQTRKISLAFIRVKGKSQDTYVVLLLVHMTDLEPDVGMGERVRRIAKDAVEALQALVVLALLLIDYAETEENLVGFVKV